MVPLVPGAGEGRWEEGWGSMGSRCERGRSEYQRGEAEQSKGKQGGVRQEEEWRDEGAGCPCKET